MKKISKIKLNQFSAEELDRRKMNALKGGCGCTIGCGNCGGTSDWSYFSTSQSNTNKSYQY